MVGMVGMTGVIGEGNGFAEEGVGEGAFEVLGHLYGEKKEEE